MRWLMWVLVGLVVFVGGYLIWTYESPIDEWRRERAESNVEMSAWRKERDRVYDLHGAEKGRLVLAIGEARRRLDAAERDGERTEVLRVDYAAAVRKLEEFDK